MDKYIREIYAYIHFTSVRACVILLLASTRVLVVLDNSNKGVARGRRKLEENHIKIL